MARNFVLFLLLMLLLLLVVVVVPVVCVREGTGIQKEGVCMRGT